MKNLWEYFKLKLDLLKDLGYLGSSNIIGTGIAGVFWFYLASELGAEDFGEIQYYLGIVGIVYYISMIGTSNTIIVLSAKNVKIQSTIFLISIVAGLISFLVLLVILQRIDVSFLLFAYIINDLGLSYLLGKKSYLKYSKNFIMQKILTVVFGLGFYYYFGLEGIIYGLALAYIHFTIIIYKGFKESKVNFSLVKSRKSFIINNYLLSLAGGLNGNIEKIIIAPMLGLVILGNYALAMQAYFILMIFSNVIFKYILPQDSSGVSNPKLKKIAILISIAISGFGITVMPTMLSYFFPKYEDATIAIQIISLSVIPATIGFICMSKLLSLEKSNLVLIGRMIALTTLILGMIILPKFFGIVGVAVAVVLTSWFQTIFFIIASMKIKVKG